MNNPEILGNSVLILGFGLEGQSTLKFLQKHYPHLKIGVADQKPDTTPLPPNVQGFFGKNYLASSRRDIDVSPSLNQEELNNRETQFDIIIRAPSIPLNHPALQKAKHVTTATNLFFAHQPGQVIGVTGTKGKSTTSALIHHFLKPYLPDVRLVGNIGKPALDYLDGATQETIFVMELSSYQLEDIRYSPHIAVLLNMVPEHLDHHGNFEAYVTAKAHITKFQTTNDILVANPSNEILQPILHQAQAKFLTFGVHQIDRDRFPLLLGEGQAFDPEAQTEWGETSFEAVKLLGPGNLQNVLAAVTVATHFHLTSEQIEQSLKTFQPLPHRLQNIGTFRGITFINDSLATIPQATVNALEAFGEKVETLITGGFDRGLDYQPLGDYLIAHPYVKTLILFPDTGVKIKQSLKLPLPQIFETSLMEEAVALAYKHTDAGKICLLSPASASFNLFKDYAERGEVFIEWVQKKQYV